MSLRRFSERFLHRELADFLASGHQDRSSPGLLAQNLHQALSSGMMDGTMQPVIDACDREVRRWLEAGEHREATGALLEIGHDRRRMQQSDERRLMMVAKALQSIGLFEASEPFYRASLERAAAGASLRPSRRVELAIARARLAIFLGDSELFAKAVDRLTRFGPVRAKGAEELRALDRFSLQEVPLTVQPGWFGDLIRETPVLLCGPGPLGGGLPHREQVLAARILANPLPDFDDLEDPAGGRTDLAYGAGSVGRQLLRPDDPFRQAVLGRFQALSFPSKDVVEALSKAGDTRVRRYRKPRLYGHGTSFMAVNILWDLLDNGAREVHVTGVTAFLGREPYRASQNRATSFGSVPGEEFNRCFEYAKNDVIFNRAVLQRLGASHRVFGDAGFVRMTGLSHREYLQELDEIYGAHRR